MTIPYRFMPVVRRGLARAHQTEDNNANLPARATVSVGLTLQAKQDGDPAGVVSGNINLQLYGPGDIIGIDPRLMVRTDPKPNATNFEPNYLAIVDFDPPDFPWMLTPAKANTRDNLRPWLVLVVLDRDQVALPALAPGRPLPSVALTAAQVKSELPDLAESWLFAHAQALSTENDSGRLATELKQSPERNISRLVCPRRLEPRKNYLACVVPAFEVGRQRGLGQTPPGGAQLAPSWQHVAPADVELPVYYHWEFSTGPVGDIETLARRLKTPDQYKNDATLIAQLNHIGELPVAVDNDHLLFEGANPARTVFEGALVSLKFAPAAADPTFALKLEAMLNSGQERASDPAPVAHDKVPTLSPPIYGEYPAKRHIVDDAKVSQHWLDQLSLQPRYRLAAGWGAEVVRRYQDEFMQAAWTQVGEVLAAERALSLSRFSHDVLKAVEKRHLAKLSPERLLAVLAPARARVKLATDETLYGRIGKATLPDELFGGAMRRLTSARRPTLRMAQWRERNLAMASIPQQVSALIDTFARAVDHVDSVDPNRFVPDGIVGSRSFDKIPLPADPSATVDLFPYLGLKESLSAGDILAIQKSVQQARAAAARTRRALPKMGDVWHDGILTETHQLRLAELQRASPVRISGVEPEKLVKQASRRGAEGVMLSVSDAGKLSAQALKIDGRDGKLKTSGAVLGSHAGTRTSASIGVLPVHALRLYGNDAVFTSLPPNTLGQGAAPVQIRLLGPGRFAPAGVTAEKPIPTITLPPAVKDRAILERYSGAFKKFEQQFRDPMVDAQIQIRAVDFALATSAAQVQLRIEPGTTVPQRLASTLTLGGHDVSWSAGQGLRNAFISPRLDLALQERLRYVIPLTFDRVMAYPHLLLPISKKLEVLAPDVFLPGVGVLPDDFIMAVQTNPRFVDALMLGVNHEMGRELLWQGFPTDQRGTPFQHFWQRLDGKTDIEPIHQWLPRPLGEQRKGGEMLVLLIRGQLLERFPNLSIYAYPKGVNDLRPGQSDPPVTPGQPGEMVPKKIELPVLRGHLGRDITYIGFDIDPQTIDAHFFILEEHMTEPRFGFDEPDGEGQDSDSWLDVDWSDVGVPPGQTFGSANLRAARPANTAPNKPMWVNPHAARVADALLQRPFRGFYAGIKLKTPE